MSAAMSMLEVVDQIGQERHANPRLYEMLVGAIAALAERNSPMVAPAFFLKVLALEGSAPVLDMCVSCGEEDADLLVAFDLVEGGVLCRTCRRGRPLSPDGLGAAAPHPRRGPGRGAGRAPFAGHRRGHRPGHRGHGGPPRPPPPLGAVGPGVVTGARHRGGPAAVNRRTAGPGCRFGVYVHVPVLPVPLRLLRLRHLHRPRPPDGGVRAGVRDRDRPGRGSTRGCPPATSVFFGGGTPSRLPADLLVGDPRRRAPPAPTPR